MTGKIQKRILICGILGTFVFSILSWRIVHLQLYRHDYYSGKAAKQHVTRRTIHARRGQIQDVRGEVLAVSFPVSRVAMNAREIKNPELLASVLATSLPMSKEEILEKIQANKHRAYTILEKKLPETEAYKLQENLKTHGLHHISFEKHFLRVYPNDEMLCHVVGYTNYGNEDELKGVQGIEQSMENVLKGHHGYRYSERDARQREIFLYRGQEKQPQHGSNVRLTIDMGLQQIVEQEIDKAVEQYTPQGISIVMMKPQTGEILAMANRPSFNPNAIPAGNTPGMINRSVITMTEPGSIFKIVTVGAVLNEGLVNQDTIIYCENGRYFYGGTSLKDHHPYGGLSVKNILVKSSNIGSAKLAMQMGEAKLHEYVHRFGFGHLTGIELPGEIRGLVNPLPQWSKISITRIPMGHEIAATSVQLVRAMAVIANGGMLVSPHLVHTVVTDDGSVVFPDAKKQTRVISRDAARVVTEALVAVVGDEGTARRAQVKGFSVAGKTGTAQRLADDGRGYSKNKYVVSFLGFMPAERPAFVMLVMVDDANTEPGMNYGGLVAAPIFAEIAGKAARYLGLEPQVEPPAETPEPRDRTKITQLTTY